MLFATCWNFTQLTVKIETVSHLVTKELHLKALFQATNLNRIGWPKLQIPSQELRQALKDLDIYSVRPIGSVQLHIRQSNGKI